MTETNLVAASNIVFPDNDAWQVADTALLTRKTLGLFTEEEVAAMLGLRSVSTLATWRSQGNGPNFVKLGKRVFYTINHIGSWINAVSTAQDAARGLVVSAGPSDARVAA